MKEKIRAKARANCAAGGGDQKSGLQKSEKAISPIHTDEELSKMGTSVLQKSEKLVALIRYNPQGL